MYRYGYNRWSIKDSLFLLSLMKNVMQINVYLTEHKYDHLLEGGNDDDDGGNSKHLLGVYGML